MAAQRLSLIDLISPQFLAGLQLPDRFQQYLGILGIDTSETFYTDETIVYTGKATISTNHLSNTTTQLQSNNGSNFSWDTPTIHFRMMVPREGARFIHDAVTDNPDSNTNLTNAESLLSDLLPAAGAAAMDDPSVVVDYPAVSFRMELLIDVLNFTLGSEWKPGIISTADRRVIIDPQRPNERVKIRLPKVLLSYEQGDDPNNLNPQFNIDSWGVTAFDSPQDLGMGELIRMDPPIAVYENQQLAFSIDRVVIDTSEEATPPEILQHFGVDEEWTGIYIGQMLLFYNNEHGIGFNFRIRDALISFKGEVSLEAALDVYLDSTLGILTAEPTFYNGSTPVTGWVRGVIRPAVENPPAGAPLGSVSLQEGAVMHLEISGGMPPYTVRVLNGTTNIWDSANRRAVFDTVGIHHIFIGVHDTDTPGVGGPLRSAEYLRVVVEAAPDPTAPPDGLSADRPPDTQPLQALAPVTVTGNLGDRQLLVPEQGSQVQLEVQGPGDFSVQVSGRRGGSPISPLNYSNQRQITLDVPNDTDLEVEVRYPGIEEDSLIQQSEIRFFYDKPTEAQITAYIDYATGASASLPNNDTIFSSKFLAFKNSLGDSPNVSRIKNVELHAYASRERNNDAYNLALSGRRKQVVEGIINHFLPGVPIGPSVAHGIEDIPYTTEIFDPGNPHHTNDENRLVVITLVAKAQPLHQITTSLRRPAPPSSGGGTPATPSPERPPEAPQMPNDIPPILKQLGIRIKLERNKLSLLELYGKIDFETALEEKIRTGPTAPSGDLDLQHGNQHDGVIDFTLTYTWDQATKETGLIFNIHSDERDTDGLLHMDNNANRDDLLKNTFGALLLFAPITNSSATALGRDSEDKAALIGLTVSLVVPAAIGLLNVFRTRRIILHGGEARTRFVNPAPGEPLRSLDVGLVFDYEVQFDIVCEELGIGLNRLPGAATPLPPPLRARYKAIGFSINYSKTDDYQGLTYSPVFDASKGYDLDLSDPSLFALPDPLGQLFSIESARLARFNPLTLEIDFAIKVDLGIITVDKFKLKIPLDPTGPPQILPSGVRVNIPGVIIGNGFVEIVDTEIEVPDDTIPEGGRVVKAKGIEGGLDLTLVSLKIRIVANVGVGTLKDNTTGREAVSVFIGMAVEFPTPIILGATGLGIYGFMGLFAMHYRRIEAEPDPTKAVGPALGWLIKASGEPFRMRTKSAAETAMVPTGPKLWEMAFDRWSFGIGVLLGTAEGGFLINLQGMLVLELPGPRILIMVKAQIITLLPANPAEPATKLETGIIGIIDIDFGRQQLTLGVMINFTIEKLLSITLPIELFFKWNDPSNWHLYLGTIAQPASANILDIVRGSAYLMIQGNELVYADYGSRVPEFLRNKRLNGIAIATGLEASLTLGDESIKIYLRIAAAAHLGVSFSPFLIVGNMQFSGELRLVILSISARGSMDVLVSKVPETDDLKVYIHGKVCGSVSLLFFEISACVGLTIGTPDYDIEPPKLVRGVYLQSFSPVLVSGQGSTKPIDASLGTALENPGTSLPDDLITVPIDSLPVIQLHATPGLDTDFASQSFVGTPGNISSSGGCLRLSDEVEVEYILKKVTLTENGSPYSSGAGKPPSVWRIDRPKNGSPTDTAIDLATFSRTPTTAPHAVERSTELNTLVEVRWENACKPAAPPAPLLFTFCKQQLGVSHNGWILEGKPLPDPEGTIRMQQQPTLMKVYQQQADASFSSLNMFLDGAGLSSCQPAKVVGLEGFNINLPDSVERKCFKLTARRVIAQKNPIVFQDELQVFSAENQKLFYSGTKGFIGFTPLRPFKSQYKTQFNKLGNLVGLSIREYMRIDFLKEPVSLVQVSFTSHNPNPRTKSSLLVQAYNSKGAKVDEATFVDRSRKAESHTLTVKGEDIRHLILRNRNFSGVFTEICYERNKRPQLPIPEDYFDCIRALQLPWCSAMDGRRMEPYSNLLRQIPVQELQKMDDERCSLLFETGGCESTLFYGAVHGKLRPHMMVQELDDALNVLNQYPLNSVIIQEITDPANELPADWIDASLPWRAAVLPTAFYLHNGLPDEYGCFLAKIGSGNEKTTRIRFLSCGERAGIPALYIGVVQLLRLSEVQHHAHVSESQTTEVDTLDGYLNDDTSIPLLKPDHTYSLSVDYIANVYSREKVSDGFTQTKTLPLSQTFAFRTDSKPPVPLAPYVLGTTPVMDERFHFYEDPIKVVFNDNAFLRMYDAYGKQLQAIIRAADGISVENGSEAVSITEEIPAQVKTPFREVIEAFIAAGKLPCVGVAKFPKHPVFIPGFGLKPLMPYTFDINFDPLDPVPEGEAVQPLFRRSFTTSRYASLEAMVTDLAKKPVRHKALRSSPAGLPAAGSGTSPSVHQLEDVVLENILRTAGFIPGDSPDQTGYTLLWTSSAAGFTPYALLIDAAEPIWRQSMKAVPKEVLNEQLQVIDPNFKIYEQKAVDAMVLLPASGQSFISHFVRSTAGTRTLVMLRSVAWPEAGTLLTVRVAQLEQEFYNLPRKELDLINLDMFPSSPWAE